MNQYVVYVDISTTLFVSFHNFEIKHFIKNKWLARLHEAFHEYEILLDNIWTLPSKHWNSNLLYQTDKPIEVN